MLKLLLLMKVKTKGEFEVMNKVWEKLEALYRLQFDIDGENGPVERSKISKILRGSEGFDTSDADLYETEDGVSKGVIYFDNLKDAILNARVPYEQKLDYIRYENISDAEIKAAIDVINYLQDIEEEY